VTTTTQHIDRTLVNHKSEKEIYRKYAQQNNKLSTIRDNSHNSNNQKYINQLPFYPRIQNVTYVHFSYNKNKLLFKGLQYNLHFKQIQWLQNLALQSETNICHLNTAQEEHVRYLVFKCMCACMCKKVYIDF
jgi:hypothetical protein